MMIIDLDGISIVWDFFKISEDEEYDLFSPALQRLFFNHQPPNNLNAFIFSILPNIDKNDFEALKILINYIFSRKTIQEKYESLSIFNSYINFYDNRYNGFFQNKKNRYLTIKDMYQSIGELTQFHHKFIDYHFSLNKQELFFRSIIHFYHLKKYDFVNIDEFNNFYDKHYCGNYNKYTQYFIPKNKCNEFYTEFMESPKNIDINEFINSFGAIFTHIQYQTITTDSLLTITLVSSNDLSDLAQEINMDFKDTMTN